MVARCAPRRDARAGVLGVERAESSGWRRGAGRPELDLLGYAPQSQRLAQLLGGVHGCSRSHGVCLDCTALGMPSVLQVASTTNREGLLPKDFMPGQSRDLVESLKNSSRNVVERPV